MNLGCDINETKDMGCTSAITSAIPDHIELLPGLLKQGADPNLPRARAILAAINAGERRLEVVKLLVEHAQTSIRHLTSMGMKTHCSRPSSLPSRIRMSSRICDQKGRRPWMSYGLKANCLRLRRVPVTTPEKSDPFLNRPLPGLMKTWDRSIRRHSQRLCRATCRSRSM